MDTTEDQIEWERQIEADSAEGKLDFLIEEAAQAEQRGETRPL